MDERSGNLVSSYSPLDPGSDNITRSSSEGSDPPARPYGGSWSFRSNSLPKSFTSDTSTSSGKGPSAWAKNFQSWTSSKESQSSGSGSKSTFTNLFSNIGFNKQTTVKIPVVDGPFESTSAPTSPLTDNGPLNSIKTGFLTGSRNAVKAVQTKARHMVSQNKRRYQEGGFDLDLSYITENIIAMGFPAGDMSSGFFGYVEGFYRNHMEEVIKFFETQHKGKYKVYNLCSERLYDAALFEGKVACFPFDDHNCPQLQLISAFCQSAYSWLKGDLENVVVVHCKAGMARTGLMISCLLLYLKFFPTCEESIAYYNQKRCIDGKGLILPSQLRYVKYFERVLREFDGETPKGRKCILRGIRLHRCPYWIRPGITVSDHNGVLFSSKKHPRTKDMMSEDIWFAAPRKGVMVFALPGERCIADVNGDFKVHFTDRHGDFYCWLNTNMMESRQILLTSDLDGFDKRRLPSPGFQVEIVVLDHNAPLPVKSRVDQPPVQGAASVQHPTQSSTQETSVPRPTSNVNPPETNGKDGDKDNIFSDSEGEEDKSTSRKARGAKEGSAGREAREHAGTAGGEARSPPNSFSTTIGGGLRNAMDRMGISQVGWTSSPNSPPNESSVAKAANESITQDGLKPSQHVGAPENNPESSSAVSGSSEVVVDGRKVDPHEASSEKFAGKGVESVDPKHVDRDGKGSFRGDPQEVSQRVEAGKFESSVPPSDFQATALASAADASVFTFGDDEDYESEEE
ncbi:unnamed protein product [Calypogeia fissa]